MKLSSSGGTGDNVPRKIGPHEVTQAVLVLNSVSAAGNRAPSKVRLHAPPSEVHRRELDDRHDRARILWVGACSKFLQVCLSVAVEVSGPIACECLEVCHLPIVIHAISID